MDQARRARAEGRGLWKQDSTAEFRLQTNEDICPPSGALILPKLFRRGIDYIKSQIHGNLTDWLLQHPDENDRVVFHGAELSLSSLRLQYNSRVSVQGDLMDFVFIEK